MEESALTHSNKGAHVATAAYVILLATLIRTGDEKCALQASEQWVENLPADAATALVLGWITESKRDARDYADCQAMMGFARWAFVETFKLVRMRVSYEEGVRQVLALGGDTDTNACIVGAALGALHGMEGIPERMVAPVVARTTKSSGQPRPDFLQTHDAVQLVDQLLALSSAQ